MAVTPSGTISLGNLNTALGRSSTATISMSDSQVYFLGGTATSGTIDMNSVRNKTTFNGTITSGIYATGKKAYNLGYDPVVSMGSFTGLIYGVTPSYFAQNSGGNFSIETPPASGNVIPASSTFRVVIGSNPIKTLTSDTAAGKILYNNTAYNAIINDDVGVARNWQLVRIS